MQGPDFSRAKKDFLALHKKASYKNILSSLQKYKFRPNVLNIVEYLRRKKYELCIISGCVDLSVKSIAKKLKIDLYAATNTMIFHDDLLQSIVSLGTDEEMKYIYLEDFCNKLGIGMTECAVISNKLNCKKVFQSTKNGITFIGSALEPYAAYSIKDLNDIKDIL
jgi:phosphoserine phosphatase